PVTILPGVDHMGIVYEAEAMKAILAAMAEGDSWRGRANDQACCGGPLRAYRVWAAHRLLAPRPDARGQAGDPRLNSVHRCGRRLALAKGAEVHTPLSARQRTDAHLRLCRSHF